MSRRIRHARPERETKRSLVLQTAAFLTLLFLVVVALPILLGPAPVTP